MSAPLSVPELVPRDPDLLEARARELATPVAPEGEGIEERLVAFRLRGRACALSAGMVLRAVARLSRPLSVPLKDGGERLVAFVEELPVPVLDLEGYASGAPRPPMGLESHPALLLDTAQGPVAVAVEGPLDLLEDHLALAAAAGDPERIRFAGMLAKGALALDTAWLKDWAEKGACP